MAGRNRSESVGEMLNIIRSSLKKDEHFEREEPHIFVIMGASGDLAKKKIYPTLWWLYRDRLLPSNTVFIGYARSGLTVGKIREKSEQWMKLKEGETERYEEFWKLNHYVRGSYDNKADFVNLDTEMTKITSVEDSNRIFYLALPPSVFEPVTLHIKKCCMNNKRWSRVIVEKPFGRDSASSEALSNHLNSLFREEELYRIDHYLGKEMVQNIMSIR